jgi:hypothetical protein
MDDGYIFTNYHNPATVQFSVHKVWNDDNNNDGKRVDEITVRLFGDGVEKESAVLSDENDWSHTFKPYKKYKNVGGKQVEINYEIIEDEVADYKPTLTENESVTTVTKPAENGTNADQTNTNTSFDLTNTHKNETTDITITKTWDDDDNAAGARPNAVTVYVYADNNLFKTVVLSKDNGWAVTIKDLAVYKGGKKIVYTITEKEVTDYTAIIEGFNITNIYDGTGKTEHEDYENPPKTDINNEYLGVTITLSTLLGSAIILRKRFN